MKAMSDTGFLLAFAVITTDIADFRIYRRHRREAIPMIYPSQQ
jgi:hypothetical protein